MQEKRLKFPRFYFLSDDDLLEILGQANKPEIVQSHLKKLFAGIHSVIFDNKSIVAVKSLEGETLTLQNPVTISLDVEVRIKYATHSYVFNKYFLEIGFLYLNIQINYFNSFKSRVRFTLTDLSLVLVSIYLIDSCVRYLENYI